MTNVMPIGVAMTPETRDHLEILRRRWGERSRSAVVRLLVEQAAREEGIKTDQGTRPDWKEPDEISTG